MSRRNNNKNSNNNNDATVALHLSPPSLAIENSSSQHRQFLMRSLDRNDAEIAALIKLHTSIVKVKEDLTSKKLFANSSFGELVLLQIGQGKLWIVDGDDESNNNNNNSTTAPLETLASDDAALLDRIHQTRGAADLCIDFMLRMKLRRRILNRLIRRLMRLSAAMDGNYTNDPPPPPRYGDARMQFDEKAVNEHDLVVKQREQVLKELQVYKEVTANLNINRGDSSIPKPPRPDTSLLKDYNETYERVYDPATGKSSFASLIKDHQQQDDKANKMGAGASSRHMTDAEYSAETLRYKAAILARVPEQPTFAQLQQHNNVFMLDERLARIKQVLILEEQEAAAAEKVDALETVKDESVVATNGVLGDVKPTESEAMAINSTEAEGTKDVSETTANNEKYKSDMEIDPVESEEQKNFEESPVTAADEKLSAVEGATDAQVDAVVAEDTTGMDTNDVNDSNTTMTSLDPVTVPSSVDKQKSVSFNLNKEMPKEAISSDINTTIQNEPDSTTTGTAANSVAGSKEKEQAVEKGILKNNNVESKSNSTVQTQAGEDLELPQKKRAISLAIVPSFHEQDLKRIRTVHADLLSVSMQDHARRRLNDATRDYNTALRVSNECVERRQKLHLQLNTISYEVHALQSKLKNEYEVDYAIAKDQWLKRKREFDHSRLDKCLPSRWGHLPEGTHYTRAFATRHDQISNPIAACLSDVIDAIDMESRGQIQIERFTEPFTPPSTIQLQGGIVDAATGETLIQRNERLERQIKQEITNLTNKLYISEEDRNRYWRKMLKTKAEFEVPHGVTNAAGQKIRVNLDLGNYHTFQMPPLRQYPMTGQSMPHETVTPINRHIAPPGIPATGPMPASAPRKSSSKRPPSAQKPKSKPKLKVKAPVTPQPDGGENPLPTESKYSLARVKERILSDGTVAPVTKPKRGPDGLFARPAGRTRKGMEWDAVRGIWVPSTAGK